MPPSRLPVPDPDEDHDRSPIRVLWLVKGLGPGGAERLLALSARFRDRERFDVRAAYLLPQKSALVHELEAQGLPVACLGRRRTEDLRWLWSLRRSLIADPVDLVHAHSPLAAVGARLVARSLRRAIRPRTVYTEHGMWPDRSRATRWASSATWRLDDAGVAVSEAVRDSLPRRRRHRCEVVIHGIDVDQVRADGAPRAVVRAEVRAELGIDIDALVVGTVANLRPVKAYPDLLAAALRVVGELPGVRFVAVGQGPQEAEVRELHARLGLGERVLLLGHRRDAIRIMAACDVFCLASRYEGLPVAMMEALALGLPVVATDVGGVREIISSGREGILVRPGHPEELAGALTSLLVDAERRSTMAAAAAERGGSLSIEKAVRRTEAVYVDLLRG